MQLIVKQKFLQLKKLQKNDLTAHLSQINYVLIHLLHSFKSGKKECSIRLIMYP